MNSLKLLLPFVLIIAGFVCIAQDTATKESPANTIKAKAKLPKLLDLGSKKCIPCKMMAPVLEKLEKEYTGIMDVEFIDVWLKENVETGKKFEIEAIPTQIFFDAEGKELTRNTGYISEGDILKKWKELGYDFEKLKQEKATAGK